MKKSAMVWMVAAAWALGGMAARGDAITGASRPFRVDTRCGEFVIEDVKSAFCHGSYGMKGGKKATFLQGVEAEVVFTVSVLGNDVELTGGAVNGRDFEGTTFTFDVGTVPAGGELVVVARGTMDGVEVESAPFRVNVDAALNPMFTGFTGLDFDFAAGKGYAEKGNAKFEIGHDAPSSSKGPSWLPKGMTRFSPTVGFKTDYSIHNGTFRFSPKVLSGVAKKKIPSRRRRPNGQFAEWCGIGIDWEVGGGLAFEWSPSDLGWLVQSAHLGGEVSGDITIPYQFDMPVPFLGGIPVVIPMRAEVKAGAALQTDLVCHFGSQANGVCRPSCWEWTFDSDRMPSLSGSIGPGNKMVNVQGGIGGNGVLKGNVGGPGESDVSYGVKGVLFGTATALNWNGRLSLDSPTYWFFGEENARRRGIRVDWVPMGREYLTKARDKRDAGFETGGYPNLGPTVARGGRADFVAYLRDDGTRGDSDRTEVVVQTGTGEEWGATEKVWDDGTADWMPSLGVAEDGTAVLAWANGNRAWGEATPEFGEVAKGLELAVAVRNAGTGAWSAQNLTDDNAADFSPVVCAAENGTAMVAWLRNEGGALFGSAESPTAVMASRWDGNAWSAPSELGRGAVSGLDLAYDGTNACVAWAFDGDGDWETAGDGGVSAAVWDGRAWGAAAVLAEGLEGVGPVVAGVDDGRGRPSPWCWWGEDGKLMERAVDGEGVTVEASVVWGGEIPATARAVHGADGVLGLAWEDGGRPVVMEYDAGMGMWGGPVAVGEAESGRMARGVSAAPGAAGVLSAWESVAVATNAEGEVEFGGTELRVASMVASAANPGVSADGFAFATGEVVAGELTGVQVTVRNTGMEGAPNVALRVWACDGELEEDEDARWELLGDDGEPVVLDLPGGAEVSATVMWMAEDYRTNLAFVARVEVPEGVGDSDAGDNEAVWRPGMPALRLENARCDAVGAEVRLLTATVRNGGLAAAEAGTAVSFRLDSPDGEEIGRDVAGVVPAGADHGYDAGIAWDMSGGTWTGAWAMVYAVIDTGNAETDASTAVPIRVMTPLDRDGEGLLDGEEEAMGTDPLNPDTNGDGVGDWEHVYVFFTDPLAGMDGRWTTNTPVRVPFEWLERFGEALAAHGGDHEAFAADTAANGRPVWACYVADLDPTDAGAQLKMRWEDGEPVYGPKSAGRVYVLEGSEDLTNPAGWCNPTNSRQRFFRVRVQVPQP